jgi:hypothetical protein
VAFFEDETTENGRKFDGSGEKKLLNYQARHFV